MVKSPNIKDTPIEDPNKKQYKHKKHETICNDKRRSPLSCGICGSQNVVRQGIRFCIQCNIEQEFLSIDIWQRFPKICECNWRYKSYYEVKKCLDCGAVEAKTCPACHKSCWTGITGEKFCKSCSYRNK